MRRFRRPTRNSREMSNPILNAFTSCLGISLYPAFADLGIGVQQLKLELELRRSAGRVFQFYARGQRSVPIVIYQVSYGFDVTHVHQPDAAEKDVAKNTAQPPLILIFKIAAITKLKHLDGQQIVAGLQKRGDIEFRRCPAVLGKPRFVPVHPD